MIDAYKEFVRTFVTSILMGTLTMAAIVGIGSATHHLTWISRAELTEIQKLHAQHKTVVAPEVN